MKHYGKRLLALLGTVALLTCIAPAGFAHSGRTDNHGGHSDPSNVSGLGSYHYHHGYPAHLHPSGYCPYTDVFPTGVRLSAEKTTMGIKETATITATVSPSNACSTRVSWNSSDTSIVRVNNGTITAVGFGSATITASTFNDKTASVKITVTEVTADSIALTGVEGPAKTIYINDTLELGAVLTPENVDRPEITWTTSDETVATVEGGLVKALTAGQATITATTTNGLTAQVALTVEEIVAEKIEIRDPGQVAIGDSVQLEAVLTPANTTFQDITWESSDSAVAEVSPEGLLTAKGVGTVTVQVIQKDVSAQLVLDIQHIPVTGVSILSAGGFEGTLPPGESTQFTAHIQPDNATYQEVTWTSGDPNLATVDENGLVTAVGKGEVTLTATTKDGVADTLTFQVGTTPNMAAIAGGAGGGGVAALGAGYVLLRKKKKAAKDQKTEGKKGPDKLTAGFLALSVAVAGGAGYVGVSGTNADKYDRATFLAEAGHPVEAATLYQELGSYQDASEQLTALIEGSPVVAFQFAAKGDVLSFGSYEQDNDPANGKEPIEWVVLDRSEERLLVLSQKVLDVHPYLPYDWLGSETEDGTDLYSWLYTDFLNNAFEDTDISPIRDLRMLTRDECEQFTTPEVREAEYTPYAKAQDPERGYKAGLMWWLHGYYLFNREYIGPVVWETGSYSNNSANVEDRVGVRPAMVISLVNGEEPTFTFRSGMKDGPIVTVDGEGNVISETTEAAAAIRERTNAIYSDGDE